MSSIVIGGGISGLSASFYLSRLTKDSIKLYESSSRLGGWIQSIRNENGTMYELGPRTMRIVGHAGEEDPWCLFRVIAFDFRREYTAVG